MPEKPDRKGHSLWNDAWRRLKKNRFAMGGLVVMVIVSASAIFAPWIVPMQPDYGQPWLRFARAPGFDHPAVLAEIRFDLGEEPAIPERIPARIADYLSTDGLLVYDVRELDEIEYRVRLRRGKVQKIQLKEGARTVKSIAVAGDLAAARLLDSEGQPTGPELKNFELARKKELPAVLADYTKEKILVLRVRTPRTEAMEKIEVELSGGKVARIERDGASLDKLRTEGRFVHKITKDGDEQRFTHYLGTDDVGRDVWSRVVYGGVISLMVGAVATLVSVLIGVVYGAVAGYLAGAPMTQWHMLVTFIAIATAACVLGTNAIINSMRAEDADPVAIDFLILLPLAVAALVGVLAGGWWVADRVPWGRRITTTGEYMMRVVDILYALPFMFLVILLMISYGRQLLTLFVALGAVQWLMMARIVRGQVLSLKEKEFVEAAHMCGSSHAGVVFRHLIPNTLGVVIVYATLTVPAVILQESFLSFIGLSVQMDGRTLDSWGSLIDQGRQALTASGGKWWILVFPSLAMAITLFSLNFLGDGLRDALDPKLKGKS
ncbi:MAG: ABC transporter permease [Planctomycetota bacterium]|jgi:ABC-type dipeptide/oligopeptide/nickel transport system permease subunit